MKTIKGLSVLFFAVLAGMNVNAQENKAMQVNLKYQYQITKNLAINAGPSFKTFVTNQKESGEFVDVIKMPHILFEHTGGKYKVAGWIGFNVGAVFFL
jgi:hypothetical protein